MATPQVEHIRRLIGGLRRDRRAHPHHGRREYSQRAREVVAECEDLLAVDPASARDLSRRAVERITSALMYIDDSTGTIAGDLTAAMALHAQACTAAPPDPKRLAAWLAKLHFDGPGWPDLRLRDFAEALGDTGQAELARLVDERDTDTASRSSTSIGVRILREQLAEISGDVDRYVAVLTQRPYPEYVKIVDALRSAGRRADAETWARKGLADSEHPIQLPEIRAACVDLLLERGAAEEALTMQLEQFQRQPVLANFTELKHVAERIGQWGGLRSEALQHLRDVAAERPAVVPELIDVLVAENELNEAWSVALSHADLVGDSRWHRLIAVREHTNPGDVIAPYQRLIEQRLAKATDNYRYGKAIKLITSVRYAYSATDQQDEFAAYVADLRERHKRKTAFMAKLDQAGF